MKRTDLLPLIALILFIGGIGFFMLAPKKPKVDYVPVEVPGSSVTLAPQQEPDNTVEVKATVIEPSFITVHGAMGAAPTAPFGESAYLAPGTYDDLVIHLDTPMSVFETYYVLMFLDDGNRVYERGIDLPIMVNGQVIKEKLTF